VAVVLGLAERYGILVVAAPTAVELPDPDDRAFVEVALSGGADALVTGNRRHFLPIDDSQEPPHLFDAAGFVRHWTESRSV
jgi:predicted nucleic acid-binding protein